ncbi:hypothetical protein SDC9_186360 [bioreactor metagenome]|uniref:Uncharacterized protein n=1 Tax=bioreactor metagenome TaxID=1076179 RepID=A0A645HIJ7_9ZZZZ
MQHGQERRADDHVGNPVGCRRAGDTKITALQRLDFRTQHPNQRTGAHRKTNDEHQQHRDSEVLRGRGVDANMHHRSEDPHSGRHHQESQRQCRFTTPAVNQTDSDKGGQHVGQTDNHGAPHLL